MLTSADFRASVQSHIELPANAHRMPRDRETVLLGATAEGVWIRMLVRFPVFAKMAVAGLIRLRKLDRLAIVIAGDAPREFRVAFAERETADEQTGISDRRLSGLVAAASREWTHPRPMPGPMRTWLGRPYPIVLLDLGLCIELAGDVLRIPRLMSGRYSWLPLVPATVADALFAGYLILVVATVVLLWRQTAAGFRLAWLLSAVQFVRPLALYIPLIHTYGSGSVEFWVVWSWSYPALIWVLLGLLYMERLRRLRL